MIANILGFFSALKAALDLWITFRNYEKAQNAKKIDEKSQSRNKAVDDLSSAVEEKDVFDAQKRISDNRP